MKKVLAKLKLSTMNLVLFIFISGLTVNAQKLDWKIVDDIKPPTRVQQTASQVLDIDGDGINDFVITERRNSPSVVWYKYNGKSWDKKFIEKEPLHIEAGGTSLDVDGDGDLDIVFGGDSRLNQIWWWENPSPNFDQPWKRYLIKNHGGKQHHDQLVGDFDNDGSQELISWNQKDSTLYLFEIPEDPKTAEVWEYKAIYSGSRKDEGLAKADINEDGKMDIIGAGKWFENMGDNEFTPHIIDKDMNYTRSVVGQLVEGGSIEIIFCPGDANGDIKWYEWKNDKWVSHVLDYIIHGHTIDVNDIDKDGNLDIFVGEMGSPGDGDKADMIIYYGNGRGEFTKNIIRTGQGTHEGRLADLNGDGILDILVKPYRQNAPKVEVMLGSQKVN